MIYHQDFTMDKELKQAYSYDRPSYMVMNALMNGFITAGLSEAQARALFSSSVIRHTLDQGFGDALEELAYSWGKHIANQHRHEPWLNEELV